MRDICNTKKQLIDELTELRQRVTELEAAEARHQRVEEALRKSQERYRLAVTASKSGAWELDIRTEEIFFDPALKRLFGYSEDELLGLDQIFNLIPLGEREDIRSHFDEVLMGKADEYTAEHRVRRKDGSMLWVSTQGILIRDENGEPLRIVGISRDITERRQAEEKVLKSERQLREVQRIAQVGSWEWDITQNITIWSDELHRILGTGPEQLESNAYAALQNYLHPEDRERVEKVIERALQDQTSFTVEYRIVRPDGTVRNIRSRGEILEGETGKPTSVVGSSQDITERKQAEETLRESEERFRKIFEEGPLGMGVLSLDDCFVTANPTLCRMLGYTEEELRALTFYDITHPDDIATSKQLARQLLNGEAPHIQTEKRYITKDRETLWINLTATFIHNDRGEPLYKLTMIEDITERKQAERALREHQENLEELVNERTAQLEERIAEVEKLNRAMTNLLEDLQSANRQLEDTSERLKAANEDLETFAYSVSHDLKAPLRGIDGYSRLLLEDHVDQLDEEGRMFLHTIRRAIDRMNQLIEDLLAYSRLERRSLTTGQVNPRALVKALVKERADDIAEQNVKLTVDIPCQSVTADAEGLTQALRNLIDNALKFTQEVPEPRIKIGGRETEKSCILWVRDNGIGFDMKYHDRIFEIFQRLHREEDYTGTGIGLAIVRRAMERMRGRAWAESAPGEGATFYLEMPKRRT